MRTLLSLLTLFLLGALPLKAQLLPPLQPEQDACNALQLCGNSFTSPYSYVGIGSVVDITNTPCSGAEGNTMWLRLDVSSAGTIVFNLTPQLAADDYDFAVLDMTGTTCDNLAAATTIRCNFNTNLNGSNPGGVVGVAASGTLNYVTAGAFGNSFCAQINANVGDVYLIMINNFGQGFGGNPGSGFTIDFTGSTAGFSDDPPTIDSYIPSCNISQQITILMSENIQCSSLAPDGSDFSMSTGVITGATGFNCTGASGYTNKITLDFAAPLPAGLHTLSVQVGSDGNTLLDLCDNPVLLPESIPVNVPNYVPLGFLVIDTPACNEIRMVMTGKVNCDSIAADGSDFAINGPQPTSIISAYGISCDTNNYVDTILLLLSQPLRTDGTYAITAKYGTDGNTQTDSCGLYQVLGNSINLVINSFDGRIVAAPDSTICKGSYINLRAENTANPPYQALNCDATPYPCNGNVTGVFVGGEEVPADNNSPFFGSFQDSRAQYLFRASELKSMGLKAGSVQSLEWKLLQKLSTQPFSNFTVKIGCTPLADLPSTFVGGLETVWSGSYTSVPGWNAFQFTAPYNWDGVNNLVVEVCFDNTSAIGADVVAHSFTSYSSVNHRYGNNQSGCAMTTQGSVSGATTFRPKLRFHICEAPLGQSAYHWSPGNFLADSTIQNPLAFVADNTDYVVTTLDNFGCAHRDGIHVNVSHRAPTISPIGSVAICERDSVRLNAGGGASYRWFADDVSGLSCLTCPDPIAKPIVTTTYYAEITDTYGCSDTLPVQVIVKPLPFVNILNNDTMIKYGQSIQLLASGAYLYSWSPVSTLSNPNVVDPMATPLEPTSYYVFGLSEGGCRNLDSVQVDIDYRGNLFVPSAFSPNGDGRNDIFRIANLSFQKVQEFRVFNRWGQEIFTTTDSKKGWDGTWKGVAQNPGVYQFLIRVGYPDGFVETYKGDVTLIR
jgi:gliding motility-associated-like protein